MINKQVVAWLEKGLCAVVVASGLALAFLALTGFARWLVVGVVLVSLVDAVRKMGRKEFDEREVYLHYVANTLAYLATFGAILAIGIHQQISHGALSPAVGILMGLCGLFGAIFGAAMRRAG